MLIVFEPLVTSKRIKNAIFGLSLNFHVTRPFHGTRQTAFCGAKHRLGAETSKARRNLIFRDIFIPKVVIKLSDQTTLVPN